MVDVKLFGPLFAAGELPAIQVAGVLVTVYVKDGQLVISADFDESELGAVTPVVVRMSGETVWSASGADQNEHGGHDIVVRQKGAEMPELVCQTHGVSLADIEDDDSFEVLAGVVADHKAGKYLGQPFAPNVCERCRAEPIDDEDSGLCALCVANNDGRVIL